MLNGHGLEPGSDYTLIYHPDFWPRIGVICLGSGTATEDGNLRIAGSLSIRDDMESAKIWLVLSNHMNCHDQHMVARDLAEYLFEYQLIDQLQGSK